MNNPRQVPKRLTEVQEEASSALEEFFATTEALAACLIAQTLSQMGDHVPTALRNHIIGLAGTFEEPAEAEASDVNA